MRELMKYKTNKQTKQKNKNRTKQTKNVFLRPTEKKDFHLFRIGELMKEKKKKQIKLSKKQYAKPKTIF